MAFSLPRVAGSVAVTVVLATIPAGSDAQGVPEDFLITLERTSYFGECPVYAVSIDARGNVISSKISTA
jgi:hypothetical protein